jgi:hypothetical protein
VKTHRSSGLEEESSRVYRFSKSNIPRTSALLEDDFPTLHEDYQLIIHLQTPSPFREATRSAESDVSLALIQLRAVVFGALAEERSASQVTNHRRVDVGGNDGLSSPNRYVPSGSLHLASSDTYPRERSYQQLGNHPCYFSHQ